MDEERIPLGASVTLGRHLDNDLVLAGEDVLDYHLRIELGQRGPNAFPLGDSTLRLNERDLADEKVGLVPGDRLHVGQQTLQVAIARRHEPDAQNWQLNGPGGGAVHPLNDALSVGRAEDNALQLQNDHVSRHHARLFLHLGAVFVQDFGSSNGTFVNGQRIIGGCRLLHGDEVSFDTLSYQLVGRGGDLTPVNPHDGARNRLPLHTAIKDRANPLGDTTEMAVARPADPVPAPGGGGETGAFLLGTSDPVRGLTFRANIGRTVIGRSDECDLVIRDRTVSGRHAELVVRPEGVTITNLMATNGTRINGEEVQSAQLHDGDVLLLGQVGLVFRDVPSTAAERPWIGNLRRVLLGALVLLILAALILLI